MSVCRKRGQTILGFVLSIMKNPRPFPFPAASRCIIASDAGQEAMFLLLLWGFQYQIVRIPFGMQILYQIIAGYAGKTKAELFHRLFVKLPLQQIAVSPFAPPAAQLVIKISQAKIFKFAGNGNL